MDLLKRVNGLDICGREGGILAQQNAARSVSVCAVTMTRQPCARTSYSYQEPDEGRSGNRYGVNNVGL